MTRERTLPQISWKVVVASVATFASAQRVGAESESTPAQTKIAAAEKTIAADANDASAQNALALAFAERARETADPEFYARADEVAKKALQSRPDDYSVQKTLAWIQLGRHEFATALELCLKLQQRLPDDPMIYGMLTDAHVELGNYADAEKACQWMLDMRPDAVSALTRGAYLRELLGDEEGAVELMLTAHDHTPPHEREYRAWILVQIGHLCLKQGKLQDALAWADKAKGLFNDYHYETALRAEVYEDLGRHEDALVQWQALVELAPHPENRFQLGRALQKVGKSAEADVEFQQFESSALAESQNWDNANRELIMYSIDVAKKPDQALKIADFEVARRRDYRTLAAHAWALHAVGQYDASRRQMDDALKVGVRDAELFYRAATIAKAQGDAEASATFARRAVELNATSHWTQLATSDAAP